MSSENTLAISDLAEEREGIRALSVTELSWVSGGKKKGSKDTGTANIPGRDGSDGGTGFSNLIDTAVSIFSNLFIEAELSYIRTEPDGTEHKAEASIRISRGVPDGRDGRDGRDGADG